MRPFGISTLIAGFDGDHKPRLFQTDPSGSNTEWKATSLGRNSKQVREFLEKNFKGELSIDEALKLTCKSLLDVVESGNKNVELVVLTENEVRYLTDDEVETLIRNL